jgi:SAM-dependent methyltransferase
VKSSGGLVQILHRKRANLTDAIRRTYREEGAGTAGRLALRWLFEGALRPVTEMHQRRLDRRLGIETRREDAPPAAVERTGRYADGTPYVPTPVRQFGRMLRALPIDNPAEFAFVDFGCGKGTTLLLAADRGFRPVVGVEVEPRLVAVARSNVAAFMARVPQRAHAIEVVHEDAAAFELPPGPTVAFLYNPFGAHTLRAVVDNMRRYLVRSTGPLYLAYYNPVHRGVVDESGLFRRLSSTTRWTLFEAVPPRATTSQADPA